MELFSEVYGCYFNVIAKILNETLKGSKSEKEISEIIKSSAFSESAFYILPKLISGEWNFLKKENATYVPLLRSSVKLPVTYLEKAWLKSLLSDKRIRLFLPDEQIIYLREYLFDTPALFDAEDFHYFDVYSDGDNYDDANSVVIEISKERNALERSMLHFASFEKQTEYDKEHDKYISYIYYDKKDETELLIRILSFGPVIKVLGPEHFLAQVKERVARQYELLFDG